MDITRNKRKYGFPITCKLLFVMLVYLNHNTAWNKEVHLLIAKTRFIFFASNVVMGTFLEAVFDKMWLDTKQSVLCRILTLFTKSKPSNWIGLFSRTFDTLEFF